MIVQVRPDVSEVLARYVKSRLRAVRSPIIRDACALRNGFQCYDPPLCFRGKIRKAETQLDAPREGADGRVSMDPVGDWGGGCGCGWREGASQLLLKKSTALAYG